ncbi:hypothetical protein A0H81_05708 [Grifola frondosa]|uniref:Uncharacterized protein n=1 Tax=Grifola frondosa TaxID=5627 RepID=A0A1C7MC02_GRIFR|nr:hypothetical protein A0H81_05708 [Grifola frondosa]
MLLSPTARLLRVWPRRAHRARRHPRALVPMSGRAVLQRFPASARRSTVLVLGERNTLLGRDVLQVRECPHHSGIRYLTLSCAGHTADYSNVRPCCRWARRTQSLFASRVTLLAGSGMALSSCSMSFALYPISSLESYAAPQFAQNCWPSLRMRCGPRALLRAHAARSSLRPNGHATGHVITFRAHVHICGSSPWFVGDHASPRSLIMTAGSVLRLISSSASIDAILNVFVATRSRSGHPRL